MTTEFSPECVRRLGYHPVGGAVQRAHYEENRRRFMEETVYTVTFTEQPAAGRQREQSVSGSGKVTAAFLRALAEQIDPARPAMRGAGADGR